MTTTILLLLGSAIVIYLACEYFVNGVEWVGHQFGVSKNATGTVLAAFGTALPESVVTFVAVVFGDSPAQKEIGVGAAIGGPLVLGTVAYAVVGLTFLLSQRHAGGSFLPRQAAHRLVDDQRWFMSIFVFKAVLGIVAFAIKPWLGVLFLLAYAAYVRQEMSAEGDAGSAHELEPLKLRPREAVPRRIWPLLQTGAALVVIFASSQVFVHQLPEILNAVIWVRQGKQTLALANISGAMMIQATIPSALGLLFTPWMLQHALVWAAVVTMLSIAGLYLCLRRDALTPRAMTGFGLLYGLFALGLYFIPLQP